MGHIGTLVQLVSGYWLTFHGSVLSLTTVHAHFLALTPVCEPDESMKRILFLCSILVSRPLVLLSFSFFIV